MNNAIGRVFAKDAGNGNVILIGASLNCFFEVGRVYEISDLMGQTFITDLGVSQSQGEPENDGGIDKLLALSQGRHCLIKDNQLKGKK